MGKSIIIKGADFSENAVIAFIEGTVVNDLWVKSGTTFGGSPRFDNFTSVVFEVEPGETYYLETDKSVGSVIAFSNTFPTGDTPYINNTRYLASIGTPVTGIVPEGAHYATIGQITTDSGNLFPSVVKFGKVNVKCEDYR